MDNIEKIYTELDTLDNEIYELIYVPSNTVNECCYVCSKSSGGSDCSWANRLVYNDDTMVDGDTIMFCPKFSFDDYGLSKRVDIPHSGIESNMYVKKDDRIVRNIHRYRDLLSQLDGCGIDTSKYRRW